MGYSLDAPSCLSIRIVSEQRPRKKKNYRNFKAKYEIVGSWEIFKMYSVFVFSFNAALVRRMSKIVKIL